MKRAISILLSVLLVSCANIAELSEDSLKETQKNEFPVIEKASDSLSFKAYGNAKGILLQSVTVADGVCQLGINKEEAKLLGISETEYDEVLTFIKGKK